MAYPICKIKNISGAQKTIRGQVYDDDEIIAIDDNDRVAHATDDDVGTFIQDAGIQIHDADGAVTGVMAQIAHLQNY